MSAAKHTPGPWSLFPTETGWIVNEAGGPGYVCTLPSVSHRREECKANASLMVAAPDLLAALKDCREALRRPSLYRWHRELGFGRWKALRRAIWCWL